MLSTSVHAIAPLSSQAIVDRLMSHPQDKYTVEEMLFVLDDINSGVGLDDLSHKWGSGGRSVVYDFIVPYAIRQVHSGKLGLKQAASLFSSYGMTERGLAWQVELLNELSRPVIDRHLQAIEDQVYAMRDHFAVLVNKTMIRFEPIFTEALSLVFVDLIRTMKRVLYPETYVEDPVCDFIDLYFDTPSFFELRTDVQVRFYTLLNAFVMDHDYNDKVFLACIIQEVVMRFDSAVSAF